MSSDIAHDLKTPINHITGYGELLIDELSEAREADEKSISSLRAVIGEARIVLALVDRTFGRISPPLPPGDWRAAFFDPLKAIFLLSHEVVSRRPDLSEDLGRIGQAAVELGHRLGIAGDWLSPSLPSPRASPQEPGGSADADQGALEESLLLPSRLSGRILAVDDDAGNLELLDRWLGRLGHSTVLAANGREALERLERERFDLVLLDLSMPGMGGIEVLKRLRNLPDRRNLPVIVLSGQTEMETVVLCIGLGAEDHIAKPFDPVLLRARVDAALEKSFLRAREQELLQAARDHNRTLESQVREQVRTLSEVQVGTIFALSRLAEARDNETGAHLERMTNYCFVLGRALEERGLVPETPGDFVGILRTVSPLHDIGKVGIPDSILLKPGSLTDGEREIMNTHTLIGASTLRDLSRKHPDNDFIAMGIEVTECHHEKWDGSGYPRRKAGKEIPLSARILAICDVYDALRSRRPYKPEKSHDEAVRIILDSFGSHFDPEIEPAFRAVGRDFDRIHTLHKDKD